MRVHPRRAIFLCFCLMTSMFILGLILDASNHITTQYTDIQDKRLLFVTEDDSQASKEGESSGFLGNKKALAQNETANSLTNQRASENARKMTVKVLTMTEPIILDASKMKEEYYRGDNQPDDILSMQPPKYLPNFKNPCWYEKDVTGDATASITVGGVKVRLRCLPYFHLIGVCKSATTDLWYRLTQHPELVRPEAAIMAKETHWWSWRRFGFDLWEANAPILHFDWYLQHFDIPAKKIQETVERTGNTSYHRVITGEGSPTVFWDFTGWNLIPQNSKRSPEHALLTPHCIQHLTPNVKLLLLLRNPVDRLFSEYLFLDWFRPVHNVSAQIFHEDVLRSIAMLDDCFSVHTQAACLYNKTLHILLPVRLMVGMYSVWLTQWLKVFPREQILIARNEDYTKDILSHIRQIEEFLELNPVSEEKMQEMTKMDRVFTRSKEQLEVGDMLPATRALLQQFYDKYNRDLAVLLNDQRYLWTD